MATKHGLLELLHGNKSGQKSFYSLVEQKREELPYKPLLAGNIGI
ncbi:MAG: hypothetical protein ACQPRJ_06470 [Solitalea-like symbiont of Acarus siro]